MVTMKMELTKKMSPHAIVKTTMNGVMKMILNSHFNVLESANLLNTLVKIKIKNNVYVPQLQNSIMMIKEDFV